ncbi:unnamed protein product [Bursaphelenchus xylophilus]|uniref:(pine wood nematode) hypothetical protein n=1 Tax=Bursaphelenchus xylophilus TaxID=6326 RepID=A0A1I7RR18_BURXY|nr:unnamed protein product [Bursaphelenchus xylophilus]CAG9130804.1 unnamed protein product [Bursaphelenchus xylophilus]
MGEGQLLQHLLQEAASIPQGLDQDSEQDHEDFSTDHQLQSMIENYQNHVLKQNQGPIVGRAGNSHYHNSRAGSSEGPAKHRIFKPNNPPIPTISHSQPCLFVTDHQTDDSVGSQYASSDPREANDNKNDVDALKTENAFLKQQIESLKKKNAAFKKLEMAYERIENEFNQMVSRRDKQEKLEQTVRGKMEQTIQRLANENELLQRQLEKLNLIVAQHHQVDPQHATSMNDLIAQYKELMEIKTRQQIEIDAQNATLIEQRNHIEMLEKALKNAQERLRDRERAAVDAVALVDKCTHQQKLLQEALDDKQKLQDEHNKQQIQLEMELTQLKMQLAKENGGPRKPVRVGDGDVMVVVQQKEDRITQLEQNLTDLQKRYTETLHKNESRSDTNELIEKIKILEKEKMEREKKIQNLMDEKQRIHGQWADERRSLDHRVRNLEQDLRHIKGGAPFAGYNGFCSDSDNSYSSFRQQSSYSNGGSILMKQKMNADSVISKVDDLKIKASENRRNPPQFNGRASKTSKPVTHSRSASSEHHRHSSASSDGHPMITNTISLINPIVNHGSGASSSADSTTNSLESNNPNLPSPSQYSPTGTSNRLASKMPSNYIESLPINTRRRIGHYVDQIKVSKRTAIALGTTGYRRPAWNTSSEEKRSIDESDEAANEKGNLKTVVEINSQNGKNTNRDTDI